MIAKKNITTHKSLCCFGITNLTDNGYFLPFFDYDNEKLLNIIPELRAFQAIYGLSTAYIIKSTRGYNALTLDKIPLEKIVEMVNNSKYIDTEYRRLALKRGFFVLRIGDDKQVVTILNSDGIYKKSSSHKNALKYFYNYEVKSENNFDFNDMLRMFVYRSEKNGFLRIDKL